MSTLISKQYAMYDLAKFPSIKKEENGKVVKEIQLIACPQTTGEPFFVTQECYPANPDSPELSLEELTAKAISHPYSEVIILFYGAVRVSVDGVLYEVPDNGAFIAKAGCKYAFQFKDRTVDHASYTIFVPQIAPDDDPDYVRLIQLTRE
ncbi:MAG: hypothetical protein IJL97_04925, partial [Lachnospiraceae bacterium]|nr:hypothetical protein [Lachnospiraceae bacterium]